MLNVLHKDEDINTQVSEALLRSASPVASPHVVMLMTFSRSPKAFREAILQHSELANCRCALEHHGYAVEIGGGAKVLVKVPHYEPLMQVISASGLRFAPRHVFVDPELEEVVTSLVNGLPKREKAYLRRSQEVPLNFANVCNETDCKLSFLRTFIEIRGPGYSTSIPSCS